MKNSLRILLLILLLPALTACPTKNGPRTEHEVAKREWTPTNTPEDQTVDNKEFQAYDIDAGYAALKGDTNQLLSKVLEPLSHLVLNKKFIGDPAFRGPRLDRMIEVFNHAFMKLLEAGDKSEAFQKIKGMHYQVIFAGCSAQLTDCVNIELFRSDTRHTRIMTHLAREFDAEIEQATKAAGSPQQCIEKNEKCRRMVAERYRRLAMGAYKYNRIDDREFAFAYLKYSRLFAELLATGRMQGSYLGKTHGQIFDILIAKYQPKDMNQAEFREFVDNFNPWRFSIQTGDIFQRGSRVMFGYAANCCLYQDKSKTKLSPAMTTALAESQKADGSFVKMVGEIKSSGSSKLFENLGLKNLAEQIESYDTRFFNEFFFVVDRLYRGDLQTAEVEMVLANANPARVREQLPKMITAYLKIQLAYMVMTTNKKMAELYNPPPGEPPVASTDVFQAAIDRSKEITDRWKHMQNRIDLLNKTLGGYFKGTWVSPEYTAATDLIGALNRNIHYVAVYPNMIVMNYFLSKMNGKRTIYSFWGPFTINADEILKNFFDGDLPQPWFQFGKDPLTLSRPLLPYAFDFMLLTETLNAFKEPTAKEFDRSTFFNVIFSKYLEENFDKLRTELDGYRHDTWGDSRAAGMTEMCKYELGSSTVPPHQVLKLAEFVKYTYGGMGNNAANEVISKLVSNAAGIAKTLRGQIESRLTFIKVLKRIIEEDLIRRGQPLVLKDGKPHPDIQRLANDIQKLNQLRVELAQFFVESHSKYFQCLMTLREVERRRANRLYEEERKYLGEVYDQLAPLALITDPAARNSAVAAFNTKLAQKAQEYLKSTNLPHNFDAAVNETTFNFSKYNLLMRMRHRVQTDIFLNQTPEELAYYGKNPVIKVAGETLSILKPRPVSIEIPPGIAYNDMISKGESVQLRLRGTREDFIAQGMVLLNAKTASYTEWRSQLTGNDAPKSYVESLVQIYLMGPITDSKTGKKWEITKEQLVDSYIQALLTNSLDKFDEKNSREFGLEGLRDSREYFKDKLFEKDFTRALPLFTDLMRDVFVDANISLEKNDREHTPVTEALEFAQELNTLKKLKAFIFDPSSIEVPDEKNPGKKVRVELIEKEVKDIYGAYVHDRMNRVVEMFKYLKAIDKDYEDNRKDARALDPRLERPFYMIGDRPVQWFDPGKRNLIDWQKDEDLRSLVQKFSTKSGQFYKTLEKVAAP